MKKISVAILVCVVVLGLIWFLQPPTQPDRDAVKPSYFKRPDFIFYDVSISEIYLGRKLWKIKGKKASLDKNNATFIKPQITFYRQKAPSLQIVAPQAWLDMKHRNIRVQRPVCRFLTTPTATLTARVLSWDHHRQALSAKYNVIFQTPDFQLKTRQLFFDKHTQTLQSPNKVDFNAAPGIRGHSDKMVYTIPQRSGLFEGHVTITKGPTTLQSEKMKIGARVIKTLSPTRLSHEDIRARANQVQYFPKLQKVILSGASEVKKGADVIRSETIVISLKDKKITTHTQPQPPTGTPTKTVQQKRTRVKISSEILFKK